MKVNTNTKTL